MKVDYTLTEDEELALNEILAIENRHKESQERKTANDLITKFIKSYLKLHVDKIRARKIKTFVADFDALPDDKKSKVTRILQGEDV